MDFKKKHLVENNKLTYILMMILQGWMIAAGYIYHTDSTCVINKSFYDMMTNPTVVTVIIIIGAAITSLGYFKYGKSEKGHLLELSGTAISYGTVLLTNFDFPYLYAFAYPIIIAIILYRKRKICQLGAAVCFIFNLAYTVEYMIFTNRTLWAQVLTNTILVFLTGLAALAATKTMNRQSDEINKEVEDKKEAAEELAQHVQNVANGVNDKIDEENEVMKLLAEAVNTSAVSVREISDSINLTAESVQTQAEMNGKITESLSSVSHQTRRMQEVSNETFTSVEEGNNIIKLLADKADAVTQINKTTAEMVQDLKEAMEGVKEITSAILDISSQTNLLSLNASIEAARAGDAGRGFAVVAEEIRNLSDNTKMSAEQIGNTIDTLTEKINEASTNMEKSVFETEEESVLITDTKEKFHNISDAVNNLTTRISKIVAEVDEVASANEEVMDAISTLSATSEEVAASSEASLEMTSNCKEQMEHANRIMKEILELTKEG